MGRFDHELLAIGDELGQIADIVLGRDDTKELGHRHAMRQSQSLGPQLVVYEWIQPPRVALSDELDIATIDPQDATLAHPPARLKHRHRPTREIA
jgi:hypothetical protein